MRPVVSQVLPLEQVVEAQKLLERGSGACVCTRTCVTCCVWPAAVRWWRQVPTIYRSRHNPVHLGLLCGPAHVC